MLDPPMNLGLYTGLAQVAQELRRRPVDKGLPVPAPGGDEALYLLIPTRVEGGEREVFELPLYRVDTEPVREGSVDLERLRRLPELRLALEVGDGPHVVQPVGELDDDDAHVAAHSHDHLPQGLRLRLLQVPGREPLELGDPVHDLRDLVPKPLRQLLFRYARILEDVVQQRGGDGRRIEPQLGQNVGRRERVIDEGLPALADLTPVGGMRGVIGLRDQLLRPLGPIPRDLLDERRYVCARRRYRPWAFFCTNWLHSEIISARRFAPFSTLRLRLTAVKSVDVVYLG